MRHGFKSRTGYQKRAASSDARRVHVLLYSWIRGSRILGSWFDRG